MARLLTNPATGAFVLDIDGAPAGLVLTSSVAGEAEILTIGVLPAARGQGGGRALIEAACAALAAGGSAVLHLEVSAANLSALTLYETSGFTRTGLRHRYYADGSDAVTMARPLI